MDKETEQKIEDEVRKQLEDATVRGMAIGARSVGTVIYNIVSPLTRNNTKNDMWRALKEVERYCKPKNADENKLD